ncbi:MAG: hypothetical protein ARM1_0409 [Candidatus Micrarchaeota archaeon]|nr:MAG: hypothetical protein ARM1_0409 [Candidatus Micrarchaeota archaeon]
MQYYLIISATIALAIIYLAKRLRNDRSISIDISYIDLVKTDINSLALSIINCEERDKTVFMYKIYDDAADIALEKLILKYRLYRDPDLDASISQYFNGSRVLATLDYIYIKELINSNEEFIFSIANGITKIAYLDLELIS